MALVTVGNTRKGIQATIYYPNRWVTAEYTASWSFLNYKQIMTERSYGQKVIVSFYARKPTSQSYYNEISSSTPDFVIPAVFLIQDCTPVELLNSATMTYSISGVADGWQNFEVPLKRDLQSGEEIWAGVWSEFTTPVWDSASVTRGTCAEFVICAFSGLGRKNDYAPYFDNGEIFDSFSGSADPKGNYSLYWCYSNTPAQEKNPRVIGKSNIGSLNKVETEYEYEDEDDCYTDIVMMEEHIEDAFLGYRTRLQSATFEKKMFLHVYQKQAVTSYYEDYVDVYEAVIIPVVYKCNANWEFTELYNLNPTIITKEETFTGWIDVEVSLKENLAAGDNIFVGFYAELLNPVWDATGEGINAAPLERYVLSSAYSAKNTLPLILNGSLVTYGHRDYSPTEFYSIYCEYYGSPLRTDYVRSVSSSGNVIAVAYKTAGLKTLLQDIKNIRDSSERKLALLRLFSDVKRFQDVEERKIDSKRNLLADGNLDDEVSRSSELKRNNSDSFGLRDFVLRSAGLVASALSLLGGSDEAERFLLANRFLKSEYHVAERIGVSRWIVRAASSVFGLWDFLRGKIREENCQTELFCPVTLELDLTCEVA